MLCWLQIPPVVGTFVRSIPLSPAGPGPLGFAISPDGAHMVTSYFDYTLSVHSLPGGEHIRTFVIEDAGEGQFDYIPRLCFGATGNILVADPENERVQEVTLTGDHVRFIGIGVINDYIWSIAANAELIVVGKWDGTSNGRIMMFDAASGALARAFCDYGKAPGQLMMFCEGIRFTPDSRHIVVAESDGVGIGRLSMFTLAGEFVRCIGEGELEGAGDVEFAANGDVIVCDRGAHRVCVYCADSNTMLRQWGDEDDAADGDYLCPTALAMCGGQLYVLDEATKRVQVFE